MSLNTPTSWKVRQADLTIAGEFMLTTFAGAYNWKILVDNFNECYHCPTTHTDVPTFLNLETFDSDLKGGHIQHYCEPTEDQVKLGNYTHSTYYFPVSSMVAA